jgi:predicted nucleic-acid-binding protein
MIGLDTNVICRYLLGDDPVQTRKAAQVIEEAADARDSCYVSKVVLCEMVWVFESCTAMERDRIARTIDDLLHSDVMEIEDRQSVHRALHLFRSGKADFADYLICDCNTVDGCKRTVTFDQELRGVAGFEVL